MITKDVSAGIGIVFDGAQRRLEAAIEPNWLIENAKVNRIGQKMTVAVDRPCGVQNAEGENENPDAEGGEKSFNFFRYSRHSEP